MLLRLSLLPLPILLAGCGSDACNLPNNDDAEPEHIQAAQFDPSKTGNLSGSVTWSAAVPDVPPITYMAPRASGDGLEKRTAENPNRPRIDAKSRAVADAVVYLRGIDPANVHPWALPPVSVEIGAAGIQIKQGDYRGRTGFVHRGESISLTSIEPMFHIVRARGDDFFSLTFPSPGEPIIRVLPKKGRIELSSGTGLSWMRADLFVSDHSYFARTDSSGKFAFEQVPAGTAELVVWLPNWIAGQPIHEPESTIIARQTYEPAYERTQPVAIEKNKSTVCDISLP